MNNLKAKPIAYSLFVLIAFCFAGVAATTGMQVKDVWSALHIAYRTVPILLAIWLVFALHAWKWPVFRNWLVPFPCLEGTWQGHIQTTWKNPKTGETPGPIPVILTIKQSFVRISCVMRTAEMTSRSYFADFWLDSNDQLRKLGYCYTSSPSVSVSNRSPVHDGTIAFEIIGDPVDKLRGTYWTTRKTTGEVTLTFRCRKRLDEYPDDLGEHPMKDR